MSSVVETFESRLGTTIGVGRGSGTTEYIVTVDTINTLTQGALTIGIATPDPNILLMSHIPKGSRHPTYNGLYAHDYRCTARLSHLVWRGEVTWSPPDQFAPDAWRISYVLGSKTVRQYVDVLGNRCEIPVYEASPFQGGEPGYKAGSIPLVLTTRTKPVPIERPFPLSDFTLDRQFATLPRNTSGIVDSYGDALNLSTFFGYDPGLVHFKGARIQETYGEMPGQADATMGTVYNVSLDFEKFSGPTGDPGRPYGFAPFVAVHTWRGDDGSETVITDQSNQIQQDKFESFRYANFADLLSHFGV